MKEKPKKIKGCRKYNIPVDYSVKKKLAKDLVRWLQTEQGQATECQETEEGWLVQSRVTGGRLSRLVKRKAECFYIRLECDEGVLNVSVTSEEDGESYQKTDDKKFSLKTAASLAVNATAGLADATVSSISNIWIGSGISEAIYDFISRHITASHQKASGSATLKAVPCLSRYVEPMSDVESAWAAGFLESGESLIAWLHTSTRTDDAKDAEMIFVMTTKKAALAAFSKTGLESHVLLSASEMTVTDAIGRDMVTIGVTVFRTQLQNDTIFREIAPLMAASSTERLHEAARLNFLHGQGDESHLEYARAALDDVMMLSDNPLAALSRFYIGIKGDKSLNDTVSFVEAASDPQFRGLPDKLTHKSDADRLNAWADIWGLNAVEKVSLAGVIQALLPESGQCARLVASLFANGREALVRKCDDKPLLIMAEIGYAVNLMRSERAEAAVEILENQLCQLPDESLFDLLPPGNSDLTRGEGGQQIRIRILELLAKARGLLGAPHAATLRELAMRQPLVRRRLALYHDAADANIRDSVTVIMRMLDKEGLMVAPEDKKTLRSGSVTALTAKAIQTQLRHPASREGSVLNKVQTFIATKKVPDHTALKSYAKRVTRDDYPEITHAVTDGSIILGLKTPDAFISFGDLNVGIRGYDGKPPFILIGSDHLEHQSAHYYTAAELRFIIGRELAHLRYGHERITSDEVWEGAFDKTMSLMGMFPVVGGYIGKLGSLSKIVSQATNVAKTVGDIKGYISHTFTVAASAKDLYQRATSGDGNFSKADTEEEARNLIGAFREMRLTADRAGLVVCGNLKAAVCAIFKSDAKLGKQLPEAEKQGLKTFLGQSDNEGNLIHQEFAIRLAALFSFYLSQEYATLRSAVTDNAGMENLQ